MHAHGAANCTGAGDTEDGRADGERHQATDEGDNFGAANDGGADDITPAQLRDTVMRKYKVVQIADEELRRLT